MTTKAAQETAEELSNRWSELLTEEPKLRIRDAAKKLGVSEANLLETSLGEGVQRLEGDLQRALVAASPIARGVSDPSSFNVR